MNIIDIIQKKKMGLELTYSEIEFALSDNVYDYQLSSLLMAIYFKGMSDDEIVNLTKIMINSGDVINLEGISNTVDKHSTGGVGDKTSLILGPLLASMGLNVAKMSGRGLGFTGGTLDKLEAIEGFNINKDSDEFISQLKRNGLVIIGQNDKLVPADKRLYALRDVTATVDSIPLIASSIMSKKIAAGADNIILDVKCGSGSFMGSFENAKMLAEKLVKIGKAFDRNTIAIISSMDQVLGYKVGNSVEVLESIDVLKGKGPNDLRELVIEIASELYVLVNPNFTKEEAINIAISNLENDKAYEKFLELIKAQGGDINKIYVAPKKIDIIANNNGFIKDIDTNKIGNSAMLLGAGRQFKDDIIDLEVGICVNFKVGDYINTGDVLFTCFYNDVDKVDSIKEMLYESITFSTEEVLKDNLIREIIR